MKVEIIASATPNGINHQFLMTYLLNDAVAIDAGALGLIPDIERQRRVRDVFLSHSHIDHVASLPIFLDNVYEYGRPCARVHASAETIETLRSDLFNERLWPDLIRLSREESAFLELLPIEADKVVQVGALSIRGIWLNHVIPTLGFVITENDRTSVAIVSDTGPTEQIWQVLDRSPGPRGVFLDVSFPNRLCWLCEKSKHLCPQLAAHEVAKVRSAVDWHIIHIKPAFHGEIVNELRTAVPEAHVAKPGTVILF
jgi:ribonuclease BN (tRNA processing enzyme)